jgi:hypothetical protein
MRAVAKTRLLRLSLVRPKLCSLFQSLSLECLLCELLCDTMSHKQSRSDSVLTEPVVFGLPVESISMGLSAMVEMTGCVT